MKPSRQFATAILRKRAEAYLSPDFKKIQQNYSNQNRMVLVQKQAHRSMTYGAAPKQSHTYVN